MQIPIPNHSADAISFAKRLIPTSRFFRALCLVCLGLAAMAGAAVVGFEAAQTELGGKMDKVLALNPVEVAKNYLGSFGAAPEHLTIDIKHKHYVKLADWRRKALERGQITSDLKNYVPATIRYQDRQMEAQVRLKGEWVDHVKSDKWSFRVQLKGDNRLFGMKRFSIQHPGTRSYLNEWFYQSALAREGIVALRYSFIAVSVNGKNLGVYAMEEHFGKELIEHNQHREGVLVRFDAGLRYKPFSLEVGSHEVAKSDFLEDMVSAGIGSQPASPLAAYDEERIAADGPLGQQLRLALDLLEAFRQGELPTHQVFDVDKLSTYFAVSELLGALWTADDWSDMRFVYNPITSRLEPVAVEGYDSVRAIESLLGLKYSSGEFPETHLHSLLFRDPVFFAKYVAALEKVSAPDYLSTLVREFEPEMGPQRKILHSEFPYKSLSRDVFRRNAEVIQCALHPETSLHAYLVKQADDRYQVELGAIQPFPVEVLRLSAGDADWVPAETVRLPGMRRFGRPEFQTVEFHATGAVPSDSLPTPVLQVHYRLWGSLTEQTDDVILRPRREHVFDESDLPRAAGNSAEFPFVTIDESARSIVLAAGDWDVTENLVFPAGYQVFAGPGVHLNLAPQVDVLSYSALRFAGSEEDPVVVSSADGRGQGLIVLNADAPSVLRRVVFRRLSTPQQDGWELTGAVTFYQSPVELHDCEFLEIDSEDALNLIKTKFTASGLFFDDTSSDAVDLDYCEGAFSHCRFHSVGGDALDFSGSRVEITDIQVDQAADKGVSIGEDSEVTGRRVSVARSNLGIAAKDLSAAVLSDVEIVDGKMGVAVFQKKPEYGPSRLQIEGLTLKNVELPYVVEDRSVLEVDGDVVPATHRNAKELIYGPAEVDASAPVSPSPGA